MRLTKDTTDGHARLSPSKAHRWTKCPGSVREEAKYPDTRNPAAVDGTHSHTLLEACLNKLKQPHEFVGLELEDHDGKFVVDCDRADRVRIATDYIQSRLDEEAEDVKVYAERKVNPEFLTGRSDMPGTVDVQIHGKDTLELIDYKDGISPVKAKDNDQLLIYALGVLSSFKIAPNVFDRFKWIRLTIIQPKLKFKGLNPINSVEYTVQEIFDKIGHYVLAANATDSPDASLRSGDHCKWCKAKGNCREFTQQTMREIGVMFSPIEIANQAADKNPNEMNDDELRELVEAAPLVRQLLESAEKEALSRMQSGKQVTGLKVVRGRGSRSWSLPENEMVERLRKMGVPKDKTHTQKLVSPAQVQKLKWENRKGETKSLSDRQLKTINDNYITKKQGGLIVALESDSRDAVIFDASPMFDEVQQENSLPDWLK